MLRVSQSADRFGTILNIDGQILGDSVSVVEDCCKEALATGKPLCLHLRDVSWIDEAGKQLISRLLRQGVRIDASGLYLSELLRRLRRG